MPTVDSSRPRRGRPGYNRETLLQVAVQVFNERGYDGTSMDDLSKKLGISKAAIYHHVASKDELLRLAVDHALDGLFEAAADAAARQAPAIDRLDHLIQGSVAVLVERLPFVTLLLRVRGNTEVEQRALARRRRFDRLVAELVAEAKDDGDIRVDVDPAIAARLLFGMINSVVEWYRPGEPTGAAGLAAAVRAMAFDGLRR
ncbi:TetR/AcrR family transcriptional regulator [Spongiactinospora sp. TRM90649]|uniref:TetR/AcrR family transcriptional regulator n=1 Tax=Spongiactinospora sp. TRM90649 TaxID=3031114 RepID=UPI0023F9106E|nr:TetR/AcrR family transcriptional regulator [Spongiactinospora sp. TRM90649]MDF5753583.1 TetR/AcrR family transcriptional regulator [Spongiactinospora sp. TRM90649]